MPHHPSTHISPRPFGHIIIIDYDMAFFISHVIWTGDTHISPRAEGPRSNMGRGLIWYVIWKMPYHNLFIIYFNASSLIFVSWPFSKTIAWYGVWIWYNNVIFVYVFIIVFIDIVLIQLHLYNNTIWFKLWFIKRCHHSLHSKHFPCLFIIHFDSSRRHK